MTDLSPYNILTQMIVQISDRDHRPNDILIQISVQTTLRHISQSNKILTQTTVQNKSIYFD